MAYGDSRSTLRPHYPPNRRYAKPLLQWCYQCVKCITLNGPTKHHPPAHILLGKYVYVPPMCIGQQLRKKRMQSNYGHDRSEGSSVLCRYLGWRQRRSEAGARLTMFPIGTCLCNARPLDGTDKLCILLWSWVNAAAALNRNVIGWKCQYTVAAVIDFHLNANGLFHAAQLSDLPGSYVLLQCNDQLDQQQRLQLHTNTYYYRTFNRVHLMEWNTTYLKYNNDTTRCNSMLTRW